MPDSDPEHNSEPGSWLLRPEFILLLSAVVGFSIGYWPPFNTPASLGGLQDGIILGIAYPVFIAGLMLVSNAILGRMMP